MEELTLHGLDEQATEALGTALAKGLFDGAFIALYGGLGAGKTTLTRAVAHGIGITNVLSPTFTIVREHKGRLPLFHFDAYRLTDSDELYAIGFDDYISRGGVIMMEWPQNVADALPGERLDIHISGSGADKRDITLTAHGTRYADLLEAFK